MERLVKCNENSVFVYTFFFLNFLSKINIVFFLEHEGFVFGFQTEMFTNFSSRISTELG